MPVSPVTGRNSPGLAAILRAPGGPTYRQIDHWTRRGHLRPQVVRSEGSRRLWQWPESEQRVAVGMARLVAAGLSLETAEKIARGAVKRGTGIRVNAGIGVQIIFEPPDVRQPGAKP